MDRTTRHALILTVLAAAATGTPVAAQDAVADDVMTVPAPDDELMAAPGDDAIDETFRYEAHWQALVDTERYDEAVEMARRWVNDASIQFGDHSAETFIPNLHLAESHYLAEDPANAVAAYSEAIKSGERAFGVFSPVLVQPLMRLGQIFQQQSDDEAAVSVLMRAKDITHRNAGIYNLEQAPIVDLLTESFWSLGDVRQATREQRLRYGTAERAYADDDPNRVPALHKWASFNARIGRMSDSRKLYHKALDILEDNYGENDLRLVDTLYRIANSVVPTGEGQNAYYPREGALALKRAIEIYKAQEFVDQADVLTAQSRLGDWYMLNGRRNRALTLYQTSIDEARADGVDEAVIDRVFGAPRLLSTPPRTVGMTSSERVRALESPRVVIAQYDLDARGYARNVRVIEDTMGLVSTTKLLRARIMGMQHRPRFVNGKAVPTYGLRFEYTFNENNSGELGQRGPYVLEEVDEAVDSAPVETAASEEAVEPDTTTN